jgi:hypothetical protein
LAAFKFDTTANMLGSMMDISEGGSKNLGRVLTSLQGYVYMCHVYMCTGRFDGFSAS